MRPTATYSPEDNKLRIYPVTRLSETEFADIKAAGFRWAPKQELFFTSWDPRAEDAAIALAGEIEDEDKSLVERAEERAERFEEYSANRSAEAEQAHAAVERLAGMIPLGQPILVGHHSEKRARKDAERIQNGMQKAVSAFETSEYWSRRAKGALHAAKYKELPAVRARRIKGLEADERKMKKTKADHEFALRFWKGEVKFKSRKDETTVEFRATEDQREFAKSVLGTDSQLGYLPVAPNEHGGHWHAWDVLRPEGERYKGCPSLTLAQIKEIALPHYSNLIARCDRWLAHYKGRLEYERAMQEESGGTAADKVKPEVGGAQPEPEPRGIGRFDRVVMNPPFECGADLKHIQHAFGFLKPGGRLVALCAQRDTTREWVEALGGVFEPLPDGSFAEQGTGVRTALVTVDANAYA